MNSQYAKYRSAIDPKVVAAVERLGLSVGPTTGARITHRQFTRDLFRGEFWLDFGSDNPRLLLSWRVDFSGGQTGGLHVVTQSYID